MDLNFEIDRGSLQDPDAMVLEAWNYKWSSAYGSEKYSPSTGKIGVDLWKPANITLSADGKRVRLEVPDLVPVDQLHVILKIKDAGGTPWEDELFWTIHTIPLDPTHDRKTD